MISFSRLILAFAVIATTILSGCVGHESSTTLSIPNGNQPLKLIATTGQINSALQQITKGTAAEITLLCGPGVDPHSFSASTQDVQAMLDANQIFYNGFHLEAKLSEHLHGALENQSWSMASAFPENYRLEWVEEGKVDPDAPFDPHIWNHLPAWSECVSAMAKQLAVIDPTNAQTYQANASAYVKQIDETHQWASQKLSGLPSDRRIIVSAHDAFSYFANAYEMEALAVLGVGNDPEADIKTMRSVAQTICDKKVPAIFMESITNPKVVQALQEACQSRDWNVEIVDQPLYSDDLGESAPQNTFLGAFRSNVELIFDSLQPDEAE